MAVLITVLMTFGRLSSDNEITAFKASGISYNKLISPAIIFGILVFFLITPFNLWILPEMNHNVRKLSLDISRNRPDVEFNEQLLNNLADKTIYLGERKNETSFNDVIIFDKSQNNHTTIVSEYGSFKSLQDGIIINLNNGAIHENLNESEYRKTYFDTYNIAIPFDEIEYTRHNKITRQEREMNIHSLIDKINLYKDKNKIAKDNILKTNLRIDSLSQKLLTLESSNNLNLLLINKVKTQLDNSVNIKSNNLQLISNYIKQINKYSVELHKKFSIPIACFIFILLGTPLGIMSKNKNMSVSVSISIVFFIIYWAFLILGEDLADRGKLNPAISMWTPNIFLGLLSYYLYKKITEENNNFSFNLNPLKILKKELK